MSERDLFANFERMRREMDQLFGDVFERGGMPRRRAGFQPAVDVVYALDPPRAIVTAELAGVDPAELEIEIEGRTLMLSGTRRPSGSRERRLPAGRDRARPVPPRRRARRRGTRPGGQGALRGRHAADRAAARPASPVTRRRCRSRVGRRRHVIEVGDRRSGPPGDVTVGRRRTSCPSGSGCCRCATRSRFPDMLVPLNVGQPAQRRADQRRACAATGRS